MNATKQNVAYVIYTSGSTGRAKGIAIEHRSGVALLHWAHETFTSEDFSGTLMATSICFDLSVFEFFAPLSWGGRVLMCENALHLPTTYPSHNVTLLNTVPSAAAELVRMQGIPATVQTVNLAGEPIAPALVQQLYQSGRIQRVFNLYGLSEDTTYSTAALLRQEGDHLP